MCVWIHKCPSVTSCCLCPCKDIFTLRDQIGHFGNRVSVGGMCGKTTPRASDLIRRESHKMCNSASNCLLRPRLVDVSVWISVLIYILHSPQVNSKVAGIAGCQGAGDRKSKRENWPLRSSLLCLADDVALASSAVVVWNRFREVCRALTGGFECLCHCKKRGENEKM